MKYKFNLGRDLIAIGVLALVISNAFDVPESFSSLLETGGGLVAVLGAFIYYGNKKKNKLE